MGLNQALVPVHLLSYITKYWRKGKYTDKTIMAAEPLRSAVSGERQERGPWWACPVVTDLLVEVAG